MPSEKKNYENYELKQTHETERRINTFATFKNKEGRNDAVRISFLQRGT